MSIKIALAGNPNSGKTTLFNDLTGANQYVGNWPGVTVEKKEGHLKGNSDVVITDLPGIYSLSPYTVEEVVARNFLVDEQVDSILNIVDGTNLERSLYLTTQLMELGIPVVVAINMMDAVRKSGVTIDSKKLEKSLGCKVVEISAVKGENLQEAAEAAVAAAGEGRKEPSHIFSGVVEHALAHIEEAKLHDIDDTKQRWYAIKIFERDEKVCEKLGIDGSMLSHIESDIENAEKEIGEDSETIITNERYDYIVPIVAEVKKEPEEKRISTSERIDRIVTNRWLGLPIFACVMFLIYYISMVAVGQPATDWVNDGLFGEGFEFFGNEVDSIPVALEGWLESIEAAPWLSGLIINGIVSGVGAVLGFVPQLIVLFICLSFVEGCGYMARVAFVLDRLFRRFGLSGKSFISMLISTGCGVPGIMSTRTIEEPRERRMTIMTTTMIPCSAKIPVIALIAGAIFDNSAWVATSAYFLGVAAIVVSGLILKRTKRFQGECSPFVMELPDYHLPTLYSIAHNVWDRTLAFIKKAGTIILLSAILIWFLSFFGFTDEGFRLLEEEELDKSILAAFGNLIAWVFAPLGFGNWQATVASVTGLVAKENLVSTMAILYGGEDVLDGALASVFTPQAAYAFLVFNLLCAPCFAAIGAMRREMGNARWTLFAVAYQCGFAWVVGMLINQIGNIVAGSFDQTGLIAMLIIIVGFIIWSMVNKKKRGQSPFCNCGCDGCTMQGECHSENKFHSSK